jgi:hypothetical protein
MADEDTMAMKNKLLAMQEARSQASGGGGEESLRVQDVIVRHIRVPGPSSQLVGGGTAAAARRRPIVLADRDPTDSIYIFDRDPTDQIIVISF